MDHLNIFPTTIGGFSDENIAKKVLPIAKKILEEPSNNTNTWNYKTTYSKDCSNIKELDFFKDYIVNLGSEYLNSTGYKRLSLVPEIFFSEMIAGDYHGQHEHPNSILSGLIYLNVPENSAPIRFYDPRPHTKYVTIPIAESNEKNWTHYNVKPHAGLVLIWPSWLTHEVLVNKSVDGRITAVFNLRF